MKVNYLFIFFILAFFQGNGQPKSTPTYSLISPYQTILTHMKYLEDENFRPDISAKVFNPKQATGEDPKAMAIALLQIYKGAGISISYENIPTDPDYKDSLTLHQIYVIDAKYPQIYLEKVDGFWYYVFCT